ncbi:MAG: LysR substrate-binding domain-containing protein [Tabrizicola sp.]|jgi:DNA-binding transcriptional LysR family regulator|nr:LysR substrate-binding domain-containing protein [Tabrizicola sp.]
MLNQIDLSRADLNLLVLFETVMAKGNVGLAAAALNLSPSAVSHGLGRLRRLLNDPLFLRTPRGVIPTERALKLAPEIAEILASVRKVLAGAEPFDPATSTRRFRLGVGDAFLCTTGPALAAGLASLAPAIGLAVLHIVPTFRQSLDEGPWDHVLAMLENRELDVAILPWLNSPARFAVRAVPGGEDRLIAASRSDHPFARNPSLDSYCQARHLVVSIRGDPVTATDAVLADLGRSRSVAMTVPNFSVAMFLAAESDLVVSLPQSLIAAHGARFGLVATPLPFDVAQGNVVVVTTRAALQDSGVAWLVDLVCSIDWSQRGP